MALGRIGLTIVATLTLLLGPGLAIGARRGRVRLLTVALPGFGILAAIGTIAWVSGGWADVTRFPAPGGPSTVATSLVALVVLWLTTESLRKARPLRIPREVGITMAVFALLLVAAAARGTWSASPPGELYGGSISRVLENGNRPDARTSYLTSAVELAGIAPYSPASSSIFAPYAFGDRGPLPGLAAVPVIAASGSQVTSHLDQPWQPFDKFGFAAYRILMEALNLLVLFGIAGLARIMAGRRAAVIAAILAGLTPFVLHEAYYTWPKMLAAFFVLLSAGKIVQRRYLFAGTALGVGYLCHPLAILWAPPLGLLLIWREVRHLRRPWRHARFAGVFRQIVRVGPALAIAPVLVTVTWNRFNEHFNPGHEPFFNYPSGVNARPAKGISDWLIGRAEQIGTTLIPGVSVYWKTAQEQIATIGGPSNWVTRWSFQYWTTLPFAFGLFGMPMLIWGLISTWKRRPWLTVITVVLPFIIFIAYWGSFISGSMREGLHPWLATLLIVAAVAAAKNWNSRWVRLSLSIAAVRIVEVLTMLIGAMLLQRSPLTTRQFLVTDIASIVFGILSLALLTIAAIRLPAVVRWAEEAPRSARSRPAGAGASGRLASLPSGPTTRQAPKAIEDIT